MGRSTSKVTFATYVETWRATSLAEARPSMLTALEVYLRRHVLPTFGHRRLADIRFSDVQAWVNGLNRTLSPGSVHKAFNVVSSVMALAVRDDKVAGSPCAGVKLPRVSKRKGWAPPSVEQIHHLADEVPHRYRALVLTAAYAGLRWSEAQGLRVDKINWLRRSITVDEVLVEANGQFFTGPPKSEAGTRTVHVPAFLIEVLAEHVRLYPDPSGYVFRSPEGQPLRRSNFQRRVFAPALERAGVGELRWHDLRHVAASLMYRAGASVKQMQEQLGHSSAQVTTDVYTHLFGDEKDSLTSALDEIARGAVAGRR